MLSARDSVEHSEFDMNLQLSDLIRGMLLDGEFVLFESYLGTMESFLEALAPEAQNEETYLDDEVSGLEDGSEESEFIGFRSLMVQEFNTVLRGSFFVSLYSFVETILEKECRSRTSRIAGACFSGIQGQGGFFLSRGLFDNSWRRFSKQNSRAVRDQKLPTSTELHCAQSR